MTTGALQVEHVVDYHVLASKVQYKSPANVDSIYDMLIGVSCP